ncbi:MAG: hypothetical protein VX447_03610 [Pseudomonadota bacterium]|uniref:hypothetical protein n=1 Tax=Gallaecimonas pentaromativorans TaxID=584787 RepID=UPI00067F4C18|nr:hypothetical protein [Gallaecimonas pentaromativorans]MED5523826.1 hypothetical protein [Pseudomonadota bacterium]
MNELIATILTSALVSTIAGVAINAWLESRKTRQATRLDALKIAIQLEGYSINCADKLADHNTAVSSEGHAGKKLGAVPNLPELKVAVGILRPKKAAVANKLLIFPQEYAQAEQSAAFWWDVVGDPDCSTSETVNQTAKLGLKSLELAKDIREAFNLPLRELVFGEYNVQNVLKENIREDA